MMVTSPLFLCLNFRVLTIIKFNPHSITRICLLSFSCIALGTIRAQEPMKLTCNPPCVEIQNLDLVLCDNQLSLNLDQAVYHIAWETCGDYQEITALRNRSTIDLSRYDCILYDVSYHEYCDEVYGVIERCSAKGVFHKPTAEIVNRVVDGLYRPSVITSLGGEENQVRIYRDDNELTAKLDEDRGSYDLDTIRGPISVRFTNVDGCDYFTHLVIEDSPYLSYNVYTPTCSTEPDGFIELTAKDGYEVVSVDWHYHDTDSLCLRSLDSRTESEFVDLKMINLSNKLDNDTISISYNFEFSECECRQTFAAAHVATLEKLLSNLDSLGLSANHGLVPVNNIFKGNLEIHGLQIIWDNHPEMGPVSSYISGEEVFYVPAIFDKIRSDIKVIYHDRYKTCTSTVSLNID